jgi:hypothetical protein
VSTVVVLVELHFPPLFGGVGLVDVKRQVSRWLVAIVSRGPALFLGVWRWLFQVALAQW